MLRQNENRVRGRVRRARRSGIVTLHRAEPGRNPIVGSVQAAPDGRWVIAARARSSEWYADAEGFQVAEGYCPPVRSKRINP